MQGGGCRTWVDASVSGEEGGRGLTRTTRERVAANAACTADGGGLSDAHSLLLADDAGENAGMTCCWSHALGCLRLRASSPAAAAVEEGEGRSWCWCWLCSRRRTASKASSGAPAAALAAAMSMENRPGGRSV